MIYKNIKVVLLELYLSRVVFKPSVTRVAPKAISGSFYG